MTVNKDLLHRVMDEILAHPEQHAQGTWATRTACGTAYCFAGFACVLSGEQIDWTGFEQGDTVLWMENGDSIKDAAKHLLGLEGSALTLFNGGNSTADLKHFVDEICDTGKVTARDPWTDEQVSP